MFKRIFGRGHTRRPASEGDQDVVEQTLPAPVVDEPAIDVAAAPQGPPQPFFELEGWPVAPGAPIFAFYEAAHAAIRALEAWRASDEPGAVTLRAIVALDAEVAAVTDGPTRVRAAAAATQVRQGLERDAAAGSAQLASLEAAVRAASVEYEATRQRLRSLAKQRQRLDEFCADLDARYREARARLESDLAGVAADAAQLVGTPPTA